VTAFLVFTEGGPLLALTSCPSVTDERVLTSLGRRGISKFIAYEVPVEYVRRIYGVPFQVIAAELEEGLDLRVLDFNGQHIFANLSLTELGRSVRHEH
jgi:hypothetical protein